MLIQHATGNSTEFLTEYEGFYLHRDIVNDWQFLVKAAAENGFELAIASAFRDFNRQLTIWNEKALGKRPVLDNDGLPIDMSVLSEDERVFAIMRWSAIPGASRHHWGTDIDIYDRAALPAGYKLQLTGDETKSGGLFEPMHKWLDTCIENQQGFDFFRPYKGRKGVAEEPWHLSHKLVSADFEACQSESGLYAFYTGLDGLMLKEAILRNFTFLYESYISC